MTTSKTDPNGDWLDTAARIGRRLVKSGEWAGDASNWKVHVSKYVPGVREGDWVPASPGLYQGSAGIGLFLSELYRLTSDADVLRTARGALHHATAGAASYGEFNCGFHSGRLGVAFALYRLAQVTRDSEPLDAAIRILLPIASAPPRANPNTDVIGGAAGAIPALLAMSQDLPAELGTDLAVRLGDHLIALARRRGVGWSWYRGDTSIHDATG